MYTEKPSFVSTDIAKFVVYTDDKICQGSICVLVYHAVSLLPLVFIIIMCWTHIIVPDLVCQACVYDQVHSLS